MGNWSLVPLNTQHYGDVEDEVAFKREFGFGIKIVNIYLTFC